MIAGAGSDADEQQPGSPTPPPASPPALGQRLVGEVTRVEPYKNFGFLRTDMLHERVYFRLVDVKGAILPVTGDRVEFDLGTNSAGYIAHNLGIHTAGAAPVPGQPPTVTNAPPALPAARCPLTTNIC